jgi:hypothetical protein
MNLELTLAGLLATFEKYNLDIWPMQVVAYLLGIVGMFFAFRRMGYSKRITTGVLMFLWLWTGIGFFLLYFAQVYTPAYVFGGLFIIQAIIFLVDLFKPRVSYGFKADIYGIVGLLFIAYAMVGYPLVGYFIGHQYPQAPPFGLTPCPLTVFTFGLFLLTEKKVPKLYLIIPLLWAIGGIMPVSVGIYEDIGLIVSGVLGTIMILYRDRKKQV